ncbi:MAG: tRNA (guanosine(46)-N7)-methyltransferase TrmB [Ferruginibacter sp.]
MAQKKLLRFAQLKTFPNVLENPPDIKGKWHLIFKNNNPIILELACGRGEYTLGLSRLHPGKNFIGIDIKGNRMFLGAKKALEENIDNARFLRTQIEKLAEYFNRGEVAGIWITFPDPQLRTSKAKKRLTHPRFLRLYQQVLAPASPLYLKTDSPELFSFTKLVIELYGLKIIEENDNVNASPSSPELKIKTHYENLDIAQSNKIHYLAFTLPLIFPEDDEQLNEILKNEREDRGRG